MWDSINYLSTPADPLVQDSLHYELFICHVEWILVCKFYWVRFWNIKYVVFVIMTYVSVLFTRLRLGTHYNVVMLDHTRLGSKVHNSSITAELYRGIRPSCWWPASGGCWAGCSTCPGPGTGRCPRHPAPTPTRPSPATTHCTIALELQTIKLYNHGEGPYSGLFLVESTY